MVTTDRKTSSEVGGCWKCSALAAPRSAIPAAAEHLPASMPKSNKDQLSVADKPAWRAASRQTCCKQVTWTFSVINSRPS